MNKRLIRTKINHLNRYNITKKQIVQCHTSIARFWINPHHKHKRPKPKILKPKIRPVKIESTE